jgi:hypothetical protein
VEGMRAASRQSFSDWSSMQYRPKTSQSSMQLALQEAAPVATHVEDSNRTVRTVQRILRTIAPTERVRNGTTPLAWCETDAVIPRSYEDEEWEEHGKGRKFSVLAMPTPLQQYSTCNCVTFRTWLAVAPKYNGIGRRLEFLVS